MNQILLLLSNRADLNILQDWLTPHYEVLGGSLDQPFDLCIVDGPILDSMGARIKARRKVETPRFLPFLLLSQRQETKMITRQLWTTIDELIYIPIEKVELSARVKILLRARQMSVELDRNRKELFQAIIEQALVGIYLIVGDRFTYLNEAAAAIFGYSPQDLIGKDPLELVCPVDRSRVTEARQNMAAKPIQYSFCAIRKDGQLVDCEAFERQIHHNGETNILGGMIDVSERMRAQRTEARLQREKLEALKQADRIKDEFLSVISHELRTPLNAIMGFGSFLEDEISGPLNEKQHEYVQKLLKGSDRMLALVDELLDFARLQAGRFEVSPTETDYLSLIDEAVAFLEPAAREKEIRIAQEVQVPETVCVDARRIMQVLTNLLSNAIKFTPKGGQVWIKAYVKGDRLITEVSDNGLGILPEDIPRLFNPFMQLDMGLTRLAGGVGLGLSISKAIIEAHNGTIIVESPGPLKGATFRFEIPLKS